MNCIHGLPGYCCAVCNGIKLEHPEFRRRRDEANLVQFGPSSLNMAKCAESESRYVASGNNHSSWRKVQADRDLFDLLKVIHVR